MPKICDIFVIGRQTMKKKFIIIFSLIITAIFATVGWGFANGAFNPAGMTPSEYKIGISYPEAMQSDKPAIILFYTDWCSYCKKFMPKFKIISKLYKDDYNFVMLNGEADNNQALVEDIALTGLPTLYIFDPKYDNRVHLNNGIYMDLKKLRAELDRYLKIRSLLDSAQSCSTPQE